jgi:hypothetical protein
VKRLMDGVSGVDGRHARLDMSGGFPGRSLVVVFTRPSFVQIVDWPWLLSFLSRPRLRYAKPWIWRNGFPGPPLPRSIDFRCWPGGYIHT